MPRVDWLVHEPLAIKLPIIFTAKRGQFSCEYAGHIYTNTDLKVLKTTVQEAIKAEYTLTWTPVLVLSTDLHRTYENVSTTSVERERIYIAHHPTIGYKQCHWTAEPEKRLAVSKTFYWPDQEFTVPTKRETSLHNALIYLPYSETAWEQAGEVLQYLQIAGKALYKALSTPDGLSTAIDMTRYLYDSYRNRNNSQEE